MTDTTNPIERVIPVTYDNRGNPVGKAQMSRPDNSIGIMTMVPDRIIPVIFVPGVMGSNLKGIGKAAGTNWTLNSVASMAPWLGRGPEQRKKTLTPSTMTVDKTGNIPAGTQQTAEELTRRNWGEVGAMSYAEFLVWLENALNDYQNPQSGERVKLMRDQLQAMVGEALLGKDEVGLSYRYRFPVHACGYNWLASNADSARLLGKRIDEVIARYKADRKKCEKVILVTHSMGGLVARHCSEVAGYRDKIFGIVHGVMPAMGAAAVYRRFKAGTEGDYVSSEVLGNDAAEMTAVLSSAAGPLQLLPTPEYGNGWLKIKDGGKEYSYPQNGDPYGEVYAVRGKWWSMCEDHLMNPLNVEKDPKKRQAQMDADWAAFAKIINKDIKVFHSKIKDRYHPNTHAFFGSHVGNKAYGTVAWSSSTGLAAATLFRNRPVEVLDARPLTPGELSKEKLPAPEINSARTVNTQYTDGGWFPDTQRRYFISEPEENGDGTVPHRSGIAPKAMCQSFLQLNVGHEPAYKASAGADNVRACRFTLRAIVKIAQAVQTTSLKYE
jgi:hypothetical protein